MSAFRSFHSKRRRICHIRRRRSVAATYLEFQSRKKITTNLFGWLGMNPRQVGAFLQEKGYETTAYTDMSQVPMDADGYVVLYFYKRYLVLPAAHYAAAQYRPGSEELMVYNDWTKKPMNRKYSFNDYALDHQADAMIVWTVDTPKERKDLAPISR